MAAPKAVRRVFPALFLCAFSPLALSSASFSDSEPELESLLSALRAERSALAVRAERWDSPLTLEPVEALLRDPLASPAWLGKRSKALGEAKTLSSLFLEGAAAMGLALPEIEESGPIALGAPIPKSLRPVLGRLLAAVAASRATLERALDSVEKEKREAALEEARELLFEDRGRRARAAPLKPMEAFDAAGVIAAAASLSRTVESALPELERLRDSLPEDFKASVATPAGLLLLSGAGAQRYGPEELGSADMVLDLGGDNVYEGPAAAAQGGEVRLVVDLGASPSFKSSGSAASGVFGVGLLFLPNPAGEKSLEGGDISLGAGLFGAGGLRLAGRVRLAGDRFTQGAGAFGAGALLSEGAGSDFEAHLAGQGFGFIRGAGLFKHAGSSAAIKGGLFYPDSREELAANSLCLGAGYGPRAFAGGGIGLAYVAGEGHRLESSYMAQGVGYWHALGALFIAGKGHELKSRRYSQGAGVHTALGALLLQGDGHAALNWGVGPAFGWDYGVGVFLGRGDSNSLYAEWASGKGDVNGHALFDLNGKGNRLSLPELGTGAFRRGAPSYGLASLRGEENAVDAETEAADTDLEKNPWGLLRMKGSSSVPAGPRPKPVWPSIERERFLLRDRERAGGFLERARALKGDAAAENYLAALTRSGLDAQVPMEAASDVLALPPGEASSFLSLIEPAQFEEYLWLRSLLPAFGSELAPAALSAWENSFGLKRAMLLGLLAQLDFKKGLEAALLSARDPDWRVRRSAALNLGVLFGREEGDEPGRLRLLEGSLGLCRLGAKNEEARRESLRVKIGAQGLPSLYAAAAAFGASSPTARRLLLLRSGNPFNPVGKGSPGMAYYESLLSEEASPPLERALLEAEAALPRARDALQAALEDAEPEVVQAALQALGQVGQENDAPLLLAYLRNPSSLLRETAAGALAKLGGSARQALSRFESPEPQARALAALACAQNPDPEVLGLLERFLRDPEPEVRRAAVAALDAVLSVRRHLRPKFRETLKTIALDGDAAAAAAARRALKEIGE